MLDWLRLDPREEPHVTIGERRLPVVIRRHPRARRMTLRLAPDGREVCISIPSWSRTAEALAFANSRTAWLADQLASLPDRQPVSPGGTLPYRGANLTIVHCEQYPRRPELSADAIRLGGPAASVPSRLRRWLEDEALRLLAIDLADYCRRGGKTTPRLALSNARRRWGSCAPDGSIRINWRLIMAPDFVRRSVVAHEVTHLTHFDHSSHFYALLRQLYEGDVAKADGWLKREGRSLYLPFG